MLSIRSLEIPVNPDRLTDSIAVEIFVDHDHISRIELNVSSFSLPETISS